MNRVRAVIVLLTVMVVAAVGGWILGTQIESPAEAAARTAAPEASPILVPAEMRELSTDVITRGTGRFGSPIDVSLAPSAFKTGPRVVTVVSGDGDAVDEGSVLMMVSGRPVFLFQGEIPAFRDLGPGMFGQDIRQLEEGLARAGFDPGDVDGRFDDATSAAITSMYRAVDLEPVVATEAQLVQARPAESALIPGWFATAGVQVPADELVFVPDVPVRIAEFLLNPGEVINGPVVSVTDATVAIDSSVPIESAGLIAEGMKVVIDEPDLGIEGTGVVSRVASGPGTDGVDGFHVYFEVLADDSPEALLNVSVRLTIPIESTGLPVLVVPVSALSLSPDGSSRVQVSKGETMESVTVEPGLSAAGFVEVQPVDGGLEEGDLVVVGFESQ